MIVLMLKTHYNARFYVFRYVGLFSELIIFTRSVISFYINLFASLYETHENIIVEFTESKLKSIFYDERKSLSEKVQYFPRKTMK